MRILVVDDSAFQRMTVASALREHPLVTDVETAAGGPEAIRQVVTGSYGLVTLDIEMPGMDGLSVLRWLFTNHPLPVLIVSDRRHDRSALRALELGAFEVIGKPAPRAGGLLEWKKLLGRCVEEAAQISLDVLRERAHSRAADPDSGKQPARSPAAAPTAGEATAALVVASSTGGPPALRELFSTLPAAPEVVAGVAQHMPPPFTRSLAQRLAACSAWHVDEASEGIALRPGAVWLAPGGRHLRFERAGARLVAQILPPSDDFRWCPSADELFASAAQLFGPRTVAVVLTGMGDDGAEGARLVERAGGVVICESRQTAVIAGMPESAAKATRSAARLPLPAIASEVSRRLSLLPPV